MGTTPIHEYPFPDGTHPTTTWYAPWEDLATAVEDKAFAGIDVQVFTSSGTWNKPAGAKFLRVRCIGPGGGGGGAAATGSAQVSGSSGGTSGGYAESILAAGDVGASETVTVGTGGAGGVGASGSNGSAASSFGAHVSADPGLGGIHQAPVAAPWIGNVPTGTIVGTGDVVIPGHSPAPPILSDHSTTGRVTGGNGADSPLGAGGPGMRSANGGNAAGYGAGGGGASNHQNQVVRTGGAGADGVVIVETFF